MSAHDKSPTTAEDIWDEVLSPPDKLNLSLGQPITVRLTKEQVEVIQTDPTRQALRPLLGPALRLSDPTATVPSDG